jgi:polyisoprenoid-binding protein YceI
MAIPEGTYTLGPDDGTLVVRTTRSGVAAKAGHDLLIEVTAWQATLEVAATASSFALEADARSLRVREATGGMQALSAEDLAGIAQTIDDEILKGCTIEFRSTQIEPTGAGLSVHGALRLADSTSPVGFEIASGAEGEVSGTAVLTQSDWGITPYSTLFGTLKVVDEVEVSLLARLPAQAGYSA